MRRYLIVANRTLGGMQLLDAVRARLDEGPARFTVLVPVPSADDPERREALEGARARLERELDRVSGLGGRADGELAEGDPFEAVRAILERETFDGVILCTLPRGLSHRLHGDLVDRVRALATVPVLHVEAPAGMSSRITARALRVTVYVGESDHHDGRPLYSEIVQRARAVGLAGATVVRGLEGFGASKVVHTARLLTMSEDLPMVITIVDTPERVESFLPELDELIAQGLVVREDVDVIKYAGRHAG